MYFYILITIASALTFDSDPAELHVLTKFQENKGICRRL